MTLHLAIVRCNCSLWSSCRELQVVKDHFARAEWTSFIRHLNIILTAHYYFNHCRFLSHKSDHTFIVGTWYLFSAEQKTKWHFVLAKELRKTDWMTIHFDYESLLCWAINSYFKTFALMIKTVTWTQKGVSRFEVYLMWIYLSQLLQLIAFSWFG